MRKDIHPDYKEVVFQDVQSDFKFLTRSTMSSNETIKWEDGKEYPLIKVEVSSASHPFYTGKKIFVDTAGRVEKFNQKYKAKQSAKPVITEAVAPEVNDPPAAEEVKEETPKAEDVKAEAPAAEEVKEETPKAEDVKSEAPAEDVKEEAPAAEEVKEEVPNSEDKEEEGEKEKEN